MTVFHYKIDIYDNEKDRNMIESNKKVLVRADTQTEASHKLYQHYSKYYIRQNLKGIIETFIE